MGGACVAVDKANFLFNTSAAPQSEVLTDAVTRYSALSFLGVPSVSPAACNSTVSAMTSLSITIKDPSLSLTLNTSERYTLVVDASGTASLSADTVYGVVRAFETFSQLVDWRSDLNTWVIPTVTVTDAPVFAHRGALVDTARHFLPLPLLYQALDAMSADKFNVLHWHIVDDQSFPYVSTAIPALSALGAWGAPDAAAVRAHTYSPAVVQAVINYAQLRGIRIIVEFDTPGHSLSWGPAVPGLLTQCYNTSTQQPIPGQFGPIDPTVEANYAFLSTLFGEVVEVFPDAYIHVGGDEVSYTCWQSNPAITAWMAANNVSTYEDLEGYYVQRVLDMVHALGKSYVAWQEVFDNGLQLQHDTVVAVWKYHSTTDPERANLPRDSATPTWQEELYNVTAAGYRAVVSSPWYLNYIAYGVDWTQYLTADLLAFNGSALQQSYVMGGEVCMWGEYVDASNFISRTWPRASAVAEALWRNPGATANITDAEARLQAHRCRLLNRGLPAEPPNGPSFCPQELVPVYLPPWQQ